MLLQILKSGAESTLLFFQNTVTISSNSHCNYMYIFCVVPALQILTQPTDTSAAAPFSGVFTCSVRNYVHLNITWHKQSGTLPHKHNTTETTSHRIIISTLTIPNVTEEDVGKYYCLVWTNNRGLRSEPAHLYYSGTYVYGCKY